MSSERSSLLRASLALGLSLALATAPSLARAHGEGAPGPHGGLIRMPGAFHTELVPGKGGQFDVYVLDISFLNASTADATLQVRFVPKSGQPSEVKCATASDHFACELPRDAQGAGEVRVHARRAGTDGAEVSYPYPFHAGGHAAHGHGHAH